MAARTKKLRVSETPLERFDRVVKQVTDRQRKAKMKKNNQPRRKSVTPTR